MTSEITLLSHSHLPSIYFCCFSSSCTSSPSLPALYFHTPLYPLPVLSSLVSLANIPLLYLSICGCLLPPHFSPFCSPTSLSSISFLFLCALNLSIPLSSHFLLSVSFASCVDHLSKCQMDTSATVAIINSFAVGTINGRAVWWWRPGLTPHFSCVSGSQENEDGV